jgi:predicted nucleic acid-binding protein
VIFVDTSAWYSSAVPNDPNYQAASTWLASNSESLLTTDFIIDETLTLLRSRAERQRAVQVGAQLFAEELAVVHFLKPAEIHAAWDAFRLFHDKDWSFTDCSRKVVIDELGISAAFSFDRHFRQFGNVRVVP